MHFTKGLSKPLNGWVKAFNPITLHDAIIRNRDMEDVVPKIKFPPKSFPPQMGKDKKPFQKEWSGKNKLSNETHDELRRKKLCFNFNKPWELGHRCIISR